VAGEPNINWASCVLLELDGADLPVSIHRKLSLASENLGPTVVVL
jgi:hypothetical protein